MPRVAQEHLDGRRRQIVEAAVRCFARVGVHRTTMQEVFAESRLSPGGVYRYFPSKQSLVLAIAQNVGGQLAAAEQAAESTAPESLASEVARLITIFDGIETDADRRRVAIAIWGESLYDEAVRRAVSELLEAVSASLAGRIAHLQATGAAPVDVNPSDVAHVVLALLPGYLLQRIWFPDLDPLTFAATAQALFSGSASQ